MSVEDNQAECYELYEQLKKASVLTNQNVRVIDELFDAFSEAYEEDDPVGEILDDLGTTLKKFNDNNNLNFDIPRFLE